MTEPNATSALHSFQQTPREDTKQKPPSASGPRPLRSAPRESLPAKSATGTPAKAPPPVNVNLDVVRAELHLLAETEPESLIKGLMLECRELVRGSANVICNPEHPELHDDYFDMLKGAVELSARLAEAIAKLRPGGAIEERHQRIVVERIERSLPAPEGRGVADS